MKTENDTTDYSFYKRPVRVLDGGRFYYKYRRGGYNPADGSYGRCMCWGEANTLIKRHQAAVPA